MFMFPKVLFSDLGFSDISVRLHNLGHLRRNKASTSFTSNHHELGRHFFNTFSQPNPWANPQSVSRMNGHSKPTPPEFVAIGDGIYPRKPDELAVSGAENRDPKYVRFGMFASE